MAALVWNDGMLRTFRLTRIRHAAQLRNGQAKFNLASLPMELINMIEDDISLHAYNSLMEEEPFIFTCDYESACFKDFFFNSDEYHHEVHDFAHEYNYPCHTKSAANAYQTSLMYKELQSEMMEEHLGSGECDSLDREANFWRQFVCHTRNRESLHLSKVGPLPLYYMGMHPYIDMMYQHAIATDAVLARFWTFIRSSRPSWPTSASCGSKLNVWQCQLLFQVELSDCLIYHPQTLK
jgi:hypothetical protein